MNEKRLWMMNKDRKIAELSVSSSRVHIDSVESWIPPYVGDIDVWATERTSPVGRANIIHLMKLAGIEDKRDFLSVAHAISLNDTFWVKEPESDVTWNKVNPYTNRFSRIISEMALNGKYMGGELRSPSPEFTLGGSADKCWKREGGRIFLYKTCGEMWSGISGIRPYCEYYANQVTEALVGHNGHFVKYGLRVGKTENGFRKPYAYCPIFTSEQYGYVPNADVRDSNGDRYGIVELDQMLGKATESRLILREMLMVDSIVMNYDRHMGNYGFLVNNDTYKMMRLAPIFDLDCSLGAFVSTARQSIPDAYEEARIIGVRTQFSSYEEQAKWAMTGSIRRKMVEMMPFHFKRFPNKELDLDDKRIAFMEYIVNTQIKRILQA